MANVLYPITKKKLLDADGPIDLLDDNIKVSAMNTSHSYSAAHDFYDDVSANAIQESANLAGKSTTGGVFDADDLTPAFTSISTDIVYLVIWKDTGTDSTSPLLAHIDTATGLTLTQDGGNVNITWNGSGIFAI